MRVKSKQSTYIPRWSMLPWKQLTLVAQVSSIVNTNASNVDLLLNHLTKYLQGDLLDKESGLPHLAFVVWYCLVALRGDVNADV